MYAARYTPKGSFVSCAAVLRTVLTCGLGVSLVITTGFLLRALPEVAAEAPAVSPSAPQSGSLQDVQLTLQARKALQQDEKLANLNLGVTVRDRVATLWGAARSADLARRAVERLRQVPGLTEVRSEMKAEAAEDALLESFAQLARPRPAAEPPAPPASPGPAALTSQASDPSWKPRVSPDGEVEAPPPEGGAPGLILPPVALPRPPLGGASEPPAVLLPPAPRATSENLTRAIDALRRGDERFRRVRSEVRDGVVHLGGTVYRWEDLFEMARAVARLPGVQRVILEDVRTEPSPLPNGGGR
jgi:osmotically-inducible protein OsmY